MPLCEARCEKSEMHRQECRVLIKDPSKRSDDDGEAFDDYDIITPLRTLLLRKDNPQLYQAIMSLEANLDAKVLLERSNRCIN